MWQPVVWCSDPCRHDWCPLWASLAAVRSYTGHVTRSAGKSGPDTARSITSPGAHLSTPRGSFRSSTARYRRAVSVEESSSLASHRHNSSAPDWLPFCQSTTASHPDAVPSSILPQSNPSALT
ncbi:unnamed protein product [Protopolystoma xenopodis]|uniref:Uncharacterized protein n=1 Tax=Protopolystoma xenopodis TaxID=117903 RepID=A0A3S5CH04_9PLAT|nr:unnamed protein product [Protopolystoma xenopodis]